MLPERDGFQVRHRAEYCPNVQQWLTIFAKLDDFEFLKTGCGTEDASLAWPNYPQCVPPLQKPPERKYLFVRSLVLPKSKLKVLQTRKLVVESMKQNSVMLFIFPKVRDHALQ
jgi:hypothetical protein